MALVRARVRVRVRVRGVYLSTMTSLLCNVWLDCRQPEKDMGKHNRR